MKKRISTLEKMSVRDLSKHIEEITQTDLCKDTKYCSTLVKLFLAKSRSLMESQQDNGIDPF